MSTSSTHPSYLALDRASLGLLTPDVRAHLDRCDECRGYFDSLHQIPPPAGLAQIRTRIARRGKRRRLSLLALPVAAAAAGLVLLAIRPQPSLPTQPSYIGAKGFSSVWIYVRHGNGTELWDGKKPLSAGDRLRLKIDPGRFQHVEVYSVDDGPDAPQLLYAGSMTSGQSTILPDAWEVDDAPGDERLLVVLSDGLVKPRWPDWLNGKAPRDVLLLPFILPKSSRAGSSAGASDR